MTDAPVDLDDMALKLSTFKLPLNWETALRLIAELRAARAAPHADEVAGLLADLKRCRWGGMNPDSPFYETTIAEAYARLENHLKGKR